MNQSLSVFALRVEGLPSRSDSFAYLVEKVGCYLSPNTKLADQAKSALLLDELLAEAFVSAVMATLRKRHGEQVGLVVERWESSPSGAELARLLARARHDTSVVRARIREGNFAPNRPPLVLAADLA